ncbi:MAG: hypothetical protein J6D02_00540 [Lachnospira sp.]|nr:hypothetical protein [Lachnospira sp.]
MKNLLKKILLSVLLQCIWIYCYILFAMVDEYNMSWKIEWWILWIIFLIFNILIQAIVYKIYKKKPLENERYKNIYMGINGLFIVFEIFLIL